MKEATFLERIAENLLEGGFARALKPKLQPVQVAKALVREMERSQVVSTDGPLVANRYIVQLHPEDLECFAGFQATLERELASYLRSYAARHGLRPLAPPTVELLPAPAGCKPGTVNVKASLADVELAAGPAPTEGRHTGDATMVMPVAAAEEKTECPELPPAYLASKAGEMLPLSKPDIAIGRALDNDIVLEGSGVSRHHARITWESGRFVLTDRGSTNGTFACGRRVTRHILSDGDELSFGEAHFIFRIANHQE